MIDRTGSLRHDRKHSPRTKQETDRIVMVEGAQVGAITMRATSGELPLNEFRLHSSTIDSPYPWHEPHRSCQG